MTALEDDATTNWQAVLLSALIPAILVTGLVWQAFAYDGSPVSMAWSLGMLCLIPLEVIRALIVSLLGTAYAEGRDPQQVVRSFLISVAILLVLCIFYLIVEGGMDSLRLLVTPALYKFMGLPLLIAVVDGVFGILSFSGDPKLQAVRLQAIAEDAMDWLGLAVLRVPFVILPVYGLLAWAGSAGLRFAAWVPMPSEGLAFRAALFYLAVYFLGKAVLVAYVQTARFALTQKRALDVPWMKRVRNITGKSGPDTEKEAARRYRDSPHARSVLHFEEDVIRSLKGKSPPVDRDPS
jgi:hypothetical protein